jgi:uridine kinase
VKIAIEPNRSRANRRNNRQKFIAARPVRAIMSPQEKKVPMPVQNRIIKVQKRNRALVDFDRSRIVGALLRAAESIGGFEQDHCPGLNDQLFASGRCDADRAEFLADTVVICLNSHPHHLIANFPPTVEAIQTQVLHALRSHGLQNTADAYECYRWGRHWLREGDITPVQFAGNGFPRKRMEKVEAWNRQHQCDTVASLNEVVRAGRLGDLIGASLAVYEQAIDEVARRMDARMHAGDRIRLLWLTGPSSSGKTTTTVKLTQCLERRGMRFLMLNLDDYFWSLMDHPTDWINDRNFEQPEALDIQLLNQHLQRLLDGETVDQPVFSFREGRRVGTRPVRLQDDQILLLDCLHGLYPPLTEGIDAASQFHVYVETLNVLREGDGSSGRLTRFADVRLMRRIIRDTRHRDKSPLSTLLHWHYVRSGELFSIIPLMGRADCVINAGLPFDLPVMKPFLVGTDSLWPGADALDAYPGFLDARIRHRRVSELLASVEGIGREDAMDTARLPGDAVLREFIGGSTIRLPHND